MTIGRWNTGCRATAWALAILLAATGIAVGAGTNPMLKGAGGNTPTLLFDKDDIRSHLPDDWDYDYLSVGYQHHGGVGEHRTLVATGTSAAPVLYLPVQAKDLDADPVEGWVGVIKVTMDGNAVDSMETVLREAWAFDSSGDDWFWVWTGLAVAHDDAGPDVNAGDLLLARTERISNVDPDDPKYALILYSLDPDNPSLVEVFRTPDGGGSDWLYPSRLATMRDGSGDILLNDALVHYDANQDAFSSNTFLTNHTLLTRYAVGDDGYLYGALDVSPLDGMHRVDPYGDDDYTRVGTIKNTGSTKGGASAAFDASGKLWSFDYKSKKYTYYLTKMNGRGKFPYKKRIVEYGGNSGTTSRLVELETGPDGNFYAVVLGTGTNSFPHNTAATDPIELWRIDPN